MATAKKSAPKKEPTTGAKKAAPKKAAVKKSVKHMVDTVRSKAKVLVHDATLQLADMVANANLHIKERHKFPFATDANMNKYADALKDHIIAAVDRGEIAAEKKGKELLQHLHDVIIIPQRGE